MAFYNFQKNSLKRTLLDMALGSFRLLLTLFYRNHIEPSKTAPRESWICSKHRHQTILLLPLNIKHGLKQPQGMTAAMTSKPSTYVCLYSHHRSHHSVKKSVFKNTTQHHLAINQESIKPATIFLLDPKNNNGSFKKVFK